MAYSGRCACGAVTLAIAGEPVAVRQCWCRYCQKASDGSAATNVMFPTDAVTVAGEVSWFSYEADSGNTLNRAFCPACGVSVLAHVSERPHFRTVRMGMLDPGHGLAPEMVIWTDAAPDWAVIPDHLERHAGQPPAPPLR